MKRLSALAILALLLLICKSGYSNSGIDSLPKATSDSIYYTAEIMPLFQGCNSDTLATSQSRKECSDKAMMKHIFGSLRYPRKAREKKIQGRVFVRFVVDRNGYVTNEEVVKDIGGDCGKEALRVVKTFPRWTPAKHNGEKVAVSMTLPVNYRLPQFNTKKKKNR